jgi:hypothetical protein
MLSVVMLVTQPVDCPAVAATHVQKWDEAARPSTQEGRRLPAGVKHLRSSDDFRMGGGLKRVMFPKTRI